MKHINFSAKSLLMVLSLLVTSLAAGAVEYAASPLSNHLQPYKDKHRLILKAIEDRTDLSITEKLKLYEKEVSQLKTEFKTARQKEYENITASLSVVNSCTSASSGGVKVCDPKCVSAPNNDMYTRNDWMSVANTNKGTTLDPQGKTACLNMSVAGKGMNEGTLTAIYRYEPGRIAAIVEQETITLFNQIVA